jgi:hypothetical protein
MLFFLLIGSLSNVHEEPFSFLSSPSDWYFIFFRKMNCSSCNMIDPEFRRCAQVFPHVPNLTFFLINCNLYPDFCHGHDVYGVPTLLLVSRSRRAREPFRGSWAAESMIEFLEHFTHIPRLANFVHIHELNATELERSILCGKCVAMPLFSPPVGKQTRELFDRFLIDADFLPATVPLDVFRSLGLVTDVPSGEPVVALNLLGRLVLSVNSSVDVHSDLQHFCRNSTPRFSYVRGLIAGDPNISVTTLFGEFEKGDAYVQFAQDKSHAPIENLSARIDSLRRKIMGAPAMNPKTQRQAQKIAILMTIREMRLGEKGQGE